MTFIIHYETKLIMKVKIDKIEIVYIFLIINYNDHYIFK